MNTTTRTVLLLAAALLLPAPSSAKPRQAQVRADVTVEPLASVLAVVSPAGAQCRVKPHGQRPVERVAPFDLPVPNGSLDVRCVLPNGRSHRAQLDVHPAQRITLRLADRGPSRPGCPPGGCSGPAMSSAAFNKLVKAMSRERDADDRLEILERTSATAYFTVRQVEKLVDLFPRSDDRVEVVELTAPHLVDRQNAPRLLEKFPRSDDREEVRWILGLWGPGSRWDGR
jgi:hypothetical protein